MLTNDGSEQAPIVSANEGELAKNEPVADMDDTTGSDGGSAANRSSEDDDYTNDSQRDNKHLSRSDTSRISGTGSADTDSSQSGGRSQY